MKGLLEFDFVYLHRDPIDMRAGINRLLSIVQSEGMGELGDKNLFVFAGRRTHSIKILYFDHSGFALWQKRLEKQRFIWPKSVSVGTVVMTPEQLGYLLEGFDLLKLKPFEKISFEQVC